MLSADDDTPTVRRALHRRLDNERDTKICDIKFVHAADHLHVTVLLQVGGLPPVKSEFDLPNSFEHAHLIDEIDEIAEACKAARMEFWLAGRPTFDGARKLPGTGLRGNWRRYG